MHILFAASEAVPFAKSGGLADVLGSLPTYLQKKGMKISLVLPKYASIPESYSERMKKIHEFSIPIDWRRQQCGIWQLEENGIDCYFIENAYYFERENLYGYFDDGERFVYFSKAIVALIPLLEEKPQVVHTHDWQTALVNAYLHQLSSEEKFSGIKRIFTIHNLKYQGRFAASVFSDLVKLPPEYFREDTLEYFGDVNFMKGGIIFAQEVTTVSPTYSREIMTPEYGEGLEGVLGANESKLSGILNGLDTCSYNPRTDPHIFANFRSSYEKKVKNKKMLQRMAGLKESSRIPLFSIVSRFTEQKGLDLITYILPQLLQQEVQLIVHGNGDARYEEAFQYFQTRYPDKVTLYLGFKEDTARKIYAGSDFFLMPSLFEPCGISQMIALRYGTIPIVRETGGLRDTIIPYNRYTGEGNGFSFRNFNGEECKDIIELALDAWRVRDIRHQLFRNALESDFSWDMSARAYEALYRKEPAI